MSEARRKLKEEAAQFFGLHERLNSLFELFHLGGSPLAFLTRELLPRFDGEFETLGCAFGPAFRCFRGAGPVESRIDFDGVEVSRIELQLVGFRKGIKDAVPRPWSGARRITPTAGADAQDTGIVVRLGEEIVYGRFPAGLTGSTGAVWRGLSRTINATKAAHITTSPTMTAIVKLSMI